MEINDIIAQFAKIRQNQISLGIQAEKRRIGHRYHLAIASFIYAKCLSESKEPLTKIADMLECLPQGYEDYSDLDQCLKPNSLTN